MKLAKDDLIAALRLRYDYYSARTMFESARERAGLADQPAYEVGDVMLLRTALAAIGDRLDKVEAYIASLLEAAPAPEVTPVPVPPPSSSATTVETTIALTGVEVAEGERVMICGGFGELGDWDPARAREMRRDGDRWLATIKTPPEARIPFKFLRRGADGNVVWESGDNRDLVAKPRIDAVWR